MRPLQALHLVLENCRPVVGARTAHFLFTEEGSAFLSEIDEDELVVLLEAWCKKRRGTVQ